MKATYQIAEKRIQICSIYEQVHHYCREYRCQGEPDFTVTTTMADIDYERKKALRNDFLEGHLLQERQSAYLEELAVYRKIAEKMPEYDTFLFHGSSVAVDGQGYLFTAKSGTGKSTHTRLWRKLLGDRAVMVNDDKPLIRVGHDCVTVFGTPYNGKHRLGNNIAVPLKAICLLERSAENHIRSIAPEEAYPMLLQQSYRPKDRTALAATLTLIDRLMGQVAFWKLGCNMDPSAAAIAFQFMSEGKRGTVC